MSAKQWLFYRETDGLFTGRRITTNDIAALKRDTPGRCVAIEGRYDRFRHRVDLSTGEVIVDESLGAQRVQERRRSATLRQIDELERRQARPMRELVRDPANAEARRRLDAIEAEIAELRGVVVS